MNDNDFDPPFMEDVSAHRYAILIASVTRSEMLPGSFRSRGIRFLESVNGRIYEKVNVALSEACNRLGSQQFLWELSGFRRLNWFTGDVKRAREGFI